MWKYMYDVPKIKRQRIIISTDCANEADDQYAVAHLLMTPKFDIKGIVAAHFNAMTEYLDIYKAGETAAASKAEVDHILDLMGLSGQYPVFTGSGFPLGIRESAPVNDGVRFIMEEAMKEEEQPLYILCQGALTDIAAAVQQEPAICSRMTCIWIGGGDYPQGGFEFNLMQDVKAANVMFSSDMPFWQIPKKVYKTLSVSLAELQRKVRPCGRIGEYLFEHLVEINNRYGETLHWPHGELWGLGDQAVISVLMQESERSDNYHMIPAPQINEQTMAYSMSDSNREIRVYNAIDYRLTLEDLFAKLEINYRI